ncbi:hypothetical protein Tco_0826262 [Tanacetum coccineum]
MTESEPKQATTKLKQRQEIAGYEAAIRLQEQLDEEESQRIARDVEVAQRLQEEIDASERQRMAQVHQAAQGFTDGSGEEQSTEKEKELSKEELQKLMMIVPVEEVYVEALHVKYPIINWDIYIEDSRKYWKIIRVGDHTEAYQTFDDMLKKFDRDDLDKLWSLVKG